MSTVPPPRWELVAADLPEYLAASVQTTRGCHHDCAFCDVIYTFGRVPRVKSAAQVLDEVRRLQRLGVKMVYFADDNFCVNKAKTKAFLGELAEVNNGFEAPLGFITQIDISVAADDELLELLADCNFMELQIGIESTNPAALEDLNKRANAMVDLVDAVKKIQSHAMVVMAHMIIGADSDDASAFQRTLDFVDEANVVHHFCHPLAAPPGTRLWYQLRREGRLVAPAVDNLTRGEMVNNVDVLTNIIPRRMTRVELFEGVAECWKRGHELAGFHARARRFIDGIDRIPKVKRLGAADAWRNRAMLASTLGHFLFGVTSEHRRAFFDLAARAGRRDPSLVQRMIFAFSNFIMERARALASARRALAQAAWERDHPELLTTLRRSTPLPHKIRQNAKQIFETAYNCVRQEVHDRETLYRTVIDAVIDYTDRFGDSFETLDDRHRAYISDSCEYVLAGLDSTAPSDEPSSLHTSRLPRGFVREILDGVDRTLRLRESSLDHGAMRKVP